MLTSWQHLYSKITLTFVLKNFVALKGDLNIILITQSEIKDKVFCNKGVMISLADNDKCCYYLLSV